MSTYFNADYSKTPPNSPQKAPDLPAHSYSAPLNPHFAASSIEASVPSHAPPRYFQPVVYPQKEVGFQPTIYRDWPMISSRCLQTLRSDLEKGDEERQFYCLGKFYELLQLASPSLGMLTSDQQAFLIGSKLKQTAMRLSCWDNNYDHFNRSILSNWDRVAEKVITKAEEMNQIALRQKLGFTQGNTLTEICQDIGENGHNTTALDFSGTYITPLLETCPTEGLYFAVLGSAEEMIYAYRLCKSLNFSGCKLSVLDPAMAEKMPKLKVLNVSHNCLQILPENFQLRSLDASNNDFKTFPNTRERYLEEMILDHNRIRALPANLGRYSNLKKLSIADNLVQEVPSSIGQLPMLQELNISSNDIKWVPMLPHSLERLDLSNNQIQKFSNLEVLTKLKYLNIWGNPVACDPQNQQYLLAIKCLIESRGGEFIA